MAGRWMWGIDGLKRNPDRSEAELPDARADIVQLFVNPAAGRYCPDRAAALQRGFEVLGARVIISECGPASPVAIDEDATRICAFGGDGTARHVAFALSQRSPFVPMSIFAGGTVNLIHREISWPTDPHIYAAHMLRANDHHSHHVVRINDTLFLACASAGPDSRAVAALSPRLKRRVGRLAYGLAFLQVLLRWRRQTIRLCFSDRTLGCEAFYVAKGRYFAGSWSFAPDANLAQPLMHVVALHRATRLSYLRFLWTLLRGGRVERLPGTTAFTCTDLHADSEFPIPVQADGDIVATLPARMQIHENPIAFC